MQGRGVARGTRQPTQALTSRPLSQRRAAAHAHPGADAAVSVSLLPDADRLTPPGLPADMLADVLGGGTPFGAGGRGGSASAPTAAARVVALTPAAAGERLIDLLAKASATAGSIFDDVGVGGLLPGGVGGGTPARARGAPAAHAHAHLPATSSYYDHPAWPPAPAPPRAAPAAARALPATASGRARRPPAAAASPARAHGGARKPAVKKAAARKDADDGARGGGTGEAGRAKPRHRPDAPPPTPTPLSPPQAAASAAWRAARAARTRRRSGAAAPTGRAPCATRAACATRRGWGRPPAGGAGAPAGTPPRPRPLTPPPPRRASGRRDPVFVWRDFAWRARAASASRPPPPQTLRRSPSPLTAAAALPPPPPPRVQH